MATTRRSFIKTVAGGTAAAAAGAWAPRTARAATPVKVGCVVLGDFGINAPTMIGIEKGFFKQNDLEAEMVPFKGGPDLLKGVLAGAADIGLTGATDPLVFRERGTGIRAIATILEKNHFTLTVGPTIKKVEDLKGGSIGVTVVGSTTWVFARMLAKKMGWDPEKDIKIVGVGGIDAQAAALRRGETQALHLRRRGVGARGPGGGAHPHAPRRGDPQVDQPGGLYHRRPDQDQAGHHPADAARPSSRATSSAATIRTRRSGSRPRASAGRRRPPGGPTSW